LATGVFAGFAMPAAAAAQTAIVTTDLNMRAGPSTEFPVVAMLPEDSRVRVHGCLTDYDWCDVSWDGERGWVNGSYLQERYRNRVVVLSDYGSELDVPIVAFRVGTYWDSYYRSRPWYGQRTRWTSRWDSDGRRRDRDRVVIREREIRSDRDRDRAVERAPRKDRVERERVERRVERPFDSDRVRDGQRSRERTVDRVERRGPASIDSGARGRGNAEVRGRSGGAGTGGGAGTSGAVNKPDGGGGPSGDRGGGPRGDRR
jgi:uncharacterized protein YraI